MAKVMIVDDSKTARFRLRRMLQRLALRTCAPEQLAALLRRFLGKPFDYLNVGHSHLDDEVRLGATTFHTVRGLDPDKAMGGPPALAIFELTDPTAGANKELIDHDSVIHCRNDAALSAIRALQNLELLQVAYSPHCSET